LSGGVEGEPFATNSSKSHAGGALTLRFGWGQKKKGSKRKQPLRGKKEEFP